MAGQRPSEMHGPSLAECAGKLPKSDTQLHERVEAAYWAALDEATSAADGEARLRRLVADLERQVPELGRLPGRGTCRRSAKAHDLTEGN